MDFGKAINDAVVSTKAIARISPQSQVRLFNKLSRVQVGSGSILGHLQIRVQRVGPKSSRTPKKFSVLGGL